MLIAYARVSTHEQNLDLQLDAFKQAGCDPKYTYTDKVSTSKPSSTRDGLERAMSQLREGDTLVVWRLDRLGRTLKELVELITDLGNRGIGFKSLTENIDTTTPGGMLIFHIFGALAQFEREIIKERTNAGLTAARSRGRLGGRPKSKALNDPKKLARFYSLYDSKEYQVKDICEMVGISRGTLYRYLGEREGGKSKKHAE